MKNRRRKRKWGYGVVVLLFFVMIIISLISINEWRNELTNIKGDLTNEQMDATVMQGFIMVGFLFAGFLIVYILFRPRNNMDKFKERLENTLELIKYKEYQLKKVEEDPYMWNSDHLEACRSEIETLKKAAEFYRKRIGD